MLGTKTEAHVRSFFVNYNRRFNLDEILAEFEAEHGLKPSKEKEKVENDVEMVRDLSNVNHYFNKYCIQLLFDDGKIL